MLYRNQSVFISGASGFIGSCLSRYFSKQGATVHALIKPTSDLWRLKDIRKQIIFHTISLSDEKKLSNLFLKIHPSYIFHLASYGNSSDESNIDKMISVNIVGTLRLLHASLPLLYKRFVYVGSSSEYGFKSKPMKETDECLPNSFYGATKLSATHLCRVFSEQFDKPISIVRPFSVYGPYEERIRFIPTVFLRLLANQPILLTKGTIRHDFIYIDDLIDLFTKVVKCTKRIAGEIFNAGTGKEYTNEEVIAMIFEVTGKKVPILKGEYAARSWDAPHWVANMDKTKRILQWKPSFPLQKGLQKTYEWFLSIDTS